LVQVLVVAEERNTVHFQFFSLKQIKVQKNNNKPICNCCCSFNLALEVVGLRKNVKTTLLERVSECWIQNKIASKKLIRQF
jgi:hypothetical protein